ncbi:hypothetical protein BDR07DRAFT_475498 [Suillus spraguei]|nr:hypothetical protein BDR07DRAFT_475498 [Suillus spraguei]
MSNTITIVNNTKEKITASITNTGDGGQPGFYGIASNNSSTWQRSNMQPGKTYQILDQSNLNMNGVTIVNNTKEKITVSITNIGENGGAGFYEIASKGSDTWHRSKLQVCHVLRTDDGNTEVFVVEPGRKYRIG